MRGHVILLGLALAFTTFAQPLSQRDDSPDYGSMTLAEAFPGLHVLSELLMNGTGTASLGHALSSIEHASLDLIASGALIQTYGPPYSNQTKGMFEHELEGKFDVSLEDFDRVDESKAKLEGIKIDFYGTLPDYNDPRKTRLNRMRLMTIPDLVRCKEMGRCNIHSFQVNLGGPPETETPKKLLEGGQVSGMCPACPRPAFPKFPEPAAAEKEPFEDHWFQAWIMSLTNG